MMTPLVSICLPVLNARKFLDARMETLHSQTLSHWELIISDNYSDDGTWEFLQQFREDPRVHLSQAPRRQMYANWNECLKRATGEYVYIATADDTCEPTLLEKMIGALEAASGKGQAESGKGQAVSGKGNSRSAMLNAQCPCEKAENIECRTSNIERRSEEGANGQPETSGLPPSGSSIQHPVSAIQHPASSILPSVSSAASSFSPHPSALSSSPRHLTLDPRPIDVAVCDYRVIDAEGKTLDLDLNTHPRRFYGEWMNRLHIRDGRTEFLIHACLGMVWVTITAVLFRRTLLDRIGFFRTDRGVAADHEWQMRAALASDIVYMPERLATWRMHDSQATVQTRREYYDVNILRSLEAVLDDPDAGIPGHWKNHAGWRDELLSVQKSLYHDGFGLYGNVARRSPREFLRNVYRALLNEPGLLRRQAARGFKWAPEFSVDGYKQLASLLEKTKSPWPPSPL